MEPKGPKTPRGHIDQPGWIGRVREVQLTPYLEKLRRRFRTDPRTGLPLAPLYPEGAEDLSIEALAFKTGKGLRIALKLFAPIVFSIFIASFFVPHALIQSVMRSVSIAGLIGFGTNWIAIKMLFRPREIRPVFGQGLIPSQRNEIIQKVADEVIEKLINEHIIKQELEDSRLMSRLIQETAQELRRLVRDPEMVKDTKQLVLTYAAKYARSDAFRDEVVDLVQKRVQAATGKSFSMWFVGRLKGVWHDPLTRIVNNELDELPNTLDRLVGEVDTALDHIPSFLEERQVKLSEALTKVVMALIREVDIRRVIVKQLSEVTSEDLEVGFREFADDKLSYITLLGGLLGLVGGFVIIWPIWSVIVLAALFGSLALLDITLYAILSRIREAKKKAQRAQASDASEDDGEDSAATAAAAVEEVDRKNVQTPNPNTNTEIAPQTAPQNQ